MLRVWDYLIDLCSDFFVPLKDWLFWVVLAWAIVACITVVRGQALHAPDPRYPTHDLWGYRYPVECRRDLSYIDLPVRRKDLGRSIDGRKTIGRWYPGAIYVDVSITDPNEEAHIIHHERCHAYMYNVYGNPHWHPE